MDREARPLNTSDEYTRSSYSPSNDFENRDSDQIRGDIRRTREEMDRTLEQLGERLHPRSLMTDFVSIFTDRRPRTTSHTGGSTVDSLQHAGSRVADTVRSNPTSSLLIGAGAALVVFGIINARRHDEYENITTRYYDDYDDALDLDDMPYGYGEPTAYGTGYTGGYVPGAYPTSGVTSGGATYYGSQSYGYEEQMRDTDHEGRPLKQRMQGAMENVRHRASDMGHRASEMAHEARERAAHMAAEARARMGRRNRSNYEYGVSERSSGPGFYDRSRERALSLGRNTGSAVRRGYGQSRDRIVGGVEDHPLAAGLIALAAGALVGAALPSCRIEDEYLGPYRDRAVREARLRAQEAAREARRVAAASANAALREAENQGLTPQQIAERARTMVNTAREDVRGEGLTAGGLKESVKAVAKAAADTAKTEGKALKGGSKDKSTGTTSGSTTGASATTTAQANKL